MAADIYPSTYIREHDLHRRAEGSFQMRGFSPLQRAPAPFTLRMQIIVKKNAYVQYPTFGKRLYLYAIHKSCHVRKIRMWGVKRKHHPHPRATAPITYSLCAVSPAAPKNIYIVSAGVAPKGSAAIAHRCGSANAPAKDEVATGTCRSSLRLRWSSSSARKCLLHPSRCAATRSRTY